MGATENKYSTKSGLPMRKSMESKSTNNLLCSNCSQTFSVRDPLHPRGLRCPLLLHCGHSACDNCIRTSLRNSYLVVCGICKHESVAAHQNADVRLDFPLNLYLLGVFAARYWDQGPEDSKVKFVPSAATSSNRKASTSKGMLQNHKLETCAECVERTAEWKCRQCEALYCGQCFTKVHKAARALSNHQKSPLDETYHHSVFETLICKDHKSHKLEFFCRNCSELVCSHCVICLHQGHDVITKKQRNEENLPELDNARDKAVEVMKRLLHTQKKLGDVLLVPTANKKLTPVEQLVTRHFMYLHGSLQLLEQKLMDRLMRAKTENSNRLELLVDELDSNIKHVREVLQEAAAARDPSNLDKVEVLEITERLLAVQQLPSHLVTTDGTSADISVRFTVDESFLAEIDNHCQLEINVDTSYCIVKSKDLPEDFVVEPVYEDSENDAAMSVSSCTSEATSYVEQADPDQKCHTASSISSTDARFSGNIIKGSSDIVTVCHLRDPSSFYVHRAGDAATLANLCKQLSKHAHTFNTPPESVLKNGLYIVQYQVDGKWYRARVQDKRPSSPENTTDDLLEILYIDYGNTEVVPCTKLRCIPPRFAHTPAMALHCSLFDLAPSNDKWSQEAVRTFAVMVNGHRVKMVVMEHSANTYQVDLCQVPGDAQDSDVPVSVRDALVFLEYAHFKAETKQTVTLAQRTSNYFQKDHFKMGEVMDVVVSHVESPHNFYVQRLGEHAQYLTSVMKDMNREYAKAGNKGLVYTPYVGMTCAAQYSVDKNWYRAKIIDLPGNKMLEVFYVDYGNQEVVPWNQIRKLHTRFLRIAAQAVHCSLSDVVPNQEHWVPGVREHIIKVTAKKVLRLYVDEVQRHQLKVTLYESLSDVDLCVNALLVRDGFATSVGVSSSLVEYHKLDGLTLPPLPCNSKQMQPKFTKNKPIANVKAQHVDGGARDVSVSEQNGADKSETVEDPFRLEVKVLSCLSPSCIYVTLASQEEQIKNLMCELQEYYETCRSHVDKWEVNNKCSAFSARYKQWYRAIIVELLPNEQAKVFLKDFAEVEVVPLVNLQLLEPQFLGIRDGAIKCHLAGIYAAGDKREWPCLACEFLAEQIAKYSNIYITKKGDIENFSLPVDLWVKWVKQGGPLEPTQEEWLTLNKKLAEQGLAIPIRRESEVESIPSLHVLKELDEQSQRANEKIVAHSLQPSVKMDCGQNDEVPPCVSCDDSFSDAEDGTGDEQEEQPLSLAQSDWLPPVPVTKKEFIAAPTYVDDDCFIYLYDMEKSADTLTVIGNALHSRFKNSQPKPHDQYWFPGQLCIVQYHSDKKWYRGKVVGVNENRTVKVMFVDYGNTEECKASEMRKNVYMGHIPVQCYKCKLEGIKPASEDGKWPVSTLDFIHVTIVEKQCHVTVKQEPRIGQPLLISLIGPGGINITELLVSMQFAIYTSPPEIYVKPDSETGTLDEETSVIIEDEEETEDHVEDEEAEVIIEDEQETENIVFGEEEIQDEVEYEETEVSNGEAGNNERNISDMKSPELDVSVQWNDLIDQEEGKQVPKKSTGKDLCYKHLKLPDSDSIAVEVTAILSATEMIIHPCKVKGSELLKMKEEFERLSENLQEHAQSQPLVSKPYIGQPCCARYTADDQWYRAVVLAVEFKGTEQKFLKIQFVDYGNVEYQPIDKVQIRGFHVLLRENFWRTVEVLHATITT
ncbi:RING finger protein 17 isoform X3 [Zootermopsis nevadensis]|uniref:RING finger protein 17 isoform X3 n=1 Tax=Zootermopsis nevadensis TaxID=136037 RepID=UPI000B8E5FF3|nr:RING finger protein 17 isoform X3 [Zootermopsis nevadensis]